MVCNFRTCTVFGVIAVGQILLLSSASTAANSSPIAKSVRSYKLCMCAYLAKSRWMKEGQTGTFELCSSSTFAWPNFLFTFRTNPQSSEMSFCWARVETTKLAQLFSLTAETYQLTLAMLPVACLLIDFELWV
jgi:hypothetical protein